MFAEVDLDTCIIGEGPIAKEIAEAAKAEQADLLVMGASGLSGMDRLIIGSTTERVIRMAGCPVLAVKSADWAKG